MDDLKPTRALAEAVNAMCERNERTRGAIIGDVLLGRRFVLVTLRRPVVVEGECWDMSSDAELVDICDLIDDFQRWQA